MSDKPNSESRVNSYDHTDSLRGERDELRKRLAKFKAGIKVLKAQLDYIESCLKG